MVNSARSEVSRPRIKEPVQKRSRETRRKILKVAMELFSEVGFNVTTTALIAQRGGFSVGSIYAHFTNKREIFLTVLDEYSEQIFSYLQASIDRIIAQEAPRSQETSRSFGPGPKLSKEIEHGKAQEAHEESATQRSA